MQITQRYTIMVTSHCKMSFEKYGQEQETSSESLGKSPIMWKEFLDTHFWSNQIGLQL